MTIDGVWLVIYSYRKFASSSLTYSSVNVKSDQIPNVSSLKQLSSENNAFIIYGNYVYDLSTMNEWHPAGFQVI